MAEAKRWLITGCSSGLGRALAELALRRGDRVAVTARDPAAIADIVALAPERAIGLALDVTVPDQVRQARDAACAAFGGIDILVNNAGYGLQGTLEDATDAQVRAMFEVNVFGAIDVIRACLPVLRDGGGGRILNVTSVGGRASGPMVSLYSATKYALEGLAAGLAGEIAGFGIRIVSIEPGAFATDFGTRSLINVAASAPYRVVAEQVESWLAHAQYEDPRDAAEVIAAAADAPDPPAQLVIGRGAHDMIAGTLAAQQAELERWRSLSLRTSVPA